MLLKTYFIPLKSVNWNMKDAEYHVPFPKSKGPRPIIMGAKVEGDKVIMNARIRYAHPVSPTPDQIKTDKSSRRTPEYRQTHPDGYNLIHSSLPGQETRCILNLTGKDIKYAYLIVTWSIEGDLKNKFSTTKDWFN